jgi:hypothetical protein
MTAGSIEGYRFGRLRIDGEIYTKDLIILPDRIISSWQRSEGHRLRIEDLGPVLQAAPELLIIGTGYLGRMWLLDSALMKLAEAGIEIALERAGTACRTYNTLRSGRRLAAALHLAC